MVKLNDHSTLADLRIEILNSEFIDPIISLVKITRIISVRFLSKPSGDELPDEMKLVEFRVLVAMHKASIVIDDNGGGRKVTPRLPELV